MYFLFLVPVEDVYRELQREKESDKYQVSGLSLKENKLGRKVILRILCFAISFVCFG